MTDRELMQMALDALEYPGPSWPDARQKAAEALRAALAQPEQEPVAWLYVVGESRYVHGHQIDEYYSLDGGETRIKGIPLYTAPPQREWQGINDEEIYLETNHIDRGERGWAVKFARAIEAKLRGKNDS